MKRRRKGSARASKDYWEEEYCRKGSEEKGSLNRDGESTLEEGGKNAVKRKEA